MPEKPIPTLSLLESAYRVWLLFCDFTLKSYAASWLSLTVNPLLTVKESLIVKSPWTLSLTTNEPNEPVETAEPLIFVLAEPPVIVNLSLSVDPVYVWKTKLLSVPLWAILAPTLPAEPWKSITPSLLLSVRWIVISGVAAFICNSDSGLVIPMPTSPTKVLYPAPQATTEPTEPVEVD